MPAHLPFNLDDLEPDARAMAEAAAKAAGLSLTEWISRFVLARRGQAEPARATPPDAPSPVAEAPPADPPTVIETPASIAREPEGDSAESEGRDAETRAAPSAPPRAAEAGPEQSGHEVPSNLDHDPSAPVLHHDQTSADGLASALVPDAAGSITDAPSPRAEAPSVDTTLAIARDEAPPRHSYAALSVAVARGSHSSLSVGADSTNLVLEAVTAGDQSVQGAAPSTSFDGSDDALTDGAQAETATTSPPALDRPESQPAVEQSPGQERGHPPEDREFPSMGDAESRPWVESPAPSAMSEQHVADGPPIAAGGVPTDSSEAQEPEDPPPPAAAVERDGDHERADSHVSSVESEVSRSWSGIATQGESYEPYAASEIAGAAEPAAIDAMPNGPADTRVPRERSDEGRFDQSSIRPALAGLDGTEDQEPAPSAITPVIAAHIETRIAEPTATGPASQPRAALPPVSRAATGQTDRSPDLSHLFVDTGGGEEAATRPNRLATVLGCAVLSLIAVAAWFYLSPTFDIESEGPFKLPPRTSALKTPDTSTLDQDPTRAPTEIDRTSVASPELSATESASLSFAGLKELAEAGNGPAQHDLAVRYARGDGVAQDYREAARWFRAAALLGIANAQYNIGVLTERGMGVDQNLPMALLWYLAAAGKGHSAAEYNVGLVYAEGKGVDADRAEAMKWFRRAAERGFAKAQYNLGVMHEQAASDSAELIEAYRWYRRAATGGEREADPRLTELRGRMSRADIDKAEDMARQPLEPSAAEIQPPEAKRP